MRRIRSLMVLAVILGPVTPLPGRALPHPQTPGRRIFPSDNVWHARVTTLPVHRRSGDWIRSMGGPGQHLHPDFGPADDPDHPYGIPYNVVDASHPDHAVDFVYADESDPGPYPVGPETTVEQGGDRHAVMLDGDACVLYEIFDFSWNGGDPLGGSGAAWDLRSNALRPASWTSADAGGLPIFAGLIRRDEVEAGVIDHAIRVTAEETDQRFIWPARHEAGARRDPTLPPMGARFRLKRRFNISGFLPETQVILRAMKRYGLIVADNGSNWFFGGAAEEGWSNEVLDELKSIRARAFQAVATGRMKVSANSGKVKPRYAGG